MLIGAVFTVAGLTSLLIPEVPFICIGALIFGPIELMIGLFGNARPRREPTSWVAPTAGVPAAETTQLCGSCGMRLDASAKFCTNCGAHIA